MKLGAFTLFFVAITIVSSQAPVAKDAGVAINLPGFGQVVNAGRPFTITWTVSDPSATSIQSIDLRSGGSANLQLTLNNILPSPIPVNPSSFVWNVPANIPTGSSYSLVMTGNNGQTTYSPYFIIIGAPAGTNPLPPAPASNPASSASPGLVTKTSTNSTTSASNSASENLKVSLISLTGVFGVTALLF